MIRRLNCIIIALFLLSVFLLGGCGKSEDILAPSENKDGVKETVEASQKAEGTEDAESTDEIKDSASITHEHEWSAWTVVRESTCSLAGEQMRSCKCGEEQTESMDKLSHQKGASKVEREASKAEDGLVCVRCVNCGETMEEEILPATGSYGLKYTLSAQGDSYGVAGLGECTDKDIVIPAYHNGLSVFGVLERAFMNAKIDSVKILDGVNFIYMSAFESSTVKKVEIGANLSGMERCVFNDCTDLVSVSIANGPDYIADATFRNCTSLFDVSLPDSVKKIESDAFYGCSALENIDFPGRLDTIGMMAFYNCTSLKKLELPEGLRNIEPYAFRRCISISEVNIPASLEYIGMSAFEACSCVKKVYLVSFEEWCEIDLVSSPFYWGNAVPYIGGKAVTEITIPEGVESLNTFLLAKWTSLEKVILPDSLKIIGENAFYGCIGLTEIVIPSNVTQIGSSAFSYCSGLTKIVIPDSVSEMGAGVFAYCTSLKSLPLPKNTAYIGNDMFRGCTGLEEIVIPEGVLKIGGRAFEGCSSLKTITLPSTLTGLGNEVFYNCPSVVLVKFNGSEGDWRRVDKLTVFNQNKFVMEYAK